MWKIISIFGPNFYKLQVQKKEILLFIDYYPGLLIEDSEAALHTKLQAQADKDGNCSS